MNKVGLSIAGMMLVLGMGLAMWTHHLMQERLSEERRSMMSARNSELYQASMKSEVEVARLSTHLAGARAGDWVEADEMAFSDFHVASGATPFLSLNMSGQHFVNDVFTIALLECLAASGFDPRKLHVEITETALLRDEEKALDIVERIRGAGVQVYLDDFGTGFSSLSHLANFQLDGIKIDVSFVRGIPHDDGKTNLTAGIISLARSLDLHVVAEGVEEQVQADFLSSLGCDYLQGWRFGKAAPLPAVRDVISA